MNRRFRTRLWFAFVAVLALVGLGAATLWIGRWTGLELFAVGLVVVVLVGWGVRTIVKRLSEPIERLTDATRRFGGGDLKHRIAFDARVLRWSERRHARTDGHGRGGRGAFDELLQLGLAWNEMAEHIERLVTQQRELLANVSHELRSPLARVRVALELVPETPENAARLADIRLDLEELERLIDDVLTASRLEARGLPSHLETVDVAALLRTLAERASLDPVLAGRPLTTQQSPNVTTLYADTALLRRALWNVIENAGRYGAPPFTLSALPEGDGVCFSVADDGPGVPAAERELIFEPFVRAAAGGDRRGVGLGLTIARRVAEVHGGTLRLADTVRGARFDLVIPRL